MKDSAATLPRPEVMTISVIIPTLNEAAALPETLRAVSTEQPHEIIVVDGGSRDSTREIATAHGAKVIESPPGQARQMNTGASHASGQILLFLHADTRLPSDWSAEVITALAGPDVVAGAFGFRIAETFTGRRVVEWFANLRSRWFQLPYGDQSLFLPRALFEELDGFADLPIMEDYEFNQRLRRRGRVLTTPSTIATSSRRWRSLGVIKTTLINQFIIIGYHLGMSPQRLAEIYQSSGDSSE